MKSILRTSTTDGERDLTGFSTESDSHRSVAALLDEAGLELWQAPEGFWAIRLKAAVAAMSSGRARRGRAGDRG